MTEKQIQLASCQFGCDPEMFFATGDGKVIGAEKVLPKDGMLASIYQDFPHYDGTPFGTPTIYNKHALVLDGVQAEFNPNPSTCRETLGAELALTFRTLKKHLATKGDVKVSFNSIVTVDKKELAELNDRARQLGCMPSLNAYTSDNAIKCNPATYLKRSAGGHIHIGLYQGTPMYQFRERLIPLMDAIVGNTCVLLDRHPEAAERRLNYGRAGEYRLPLHGIEYRTLSNFWLQSYQLFSLVMGLTRMAVSTLYTTLDGGQDMLGNYMRWDAECDLMKRFDLKALAHAINTNDYKLAYANYKHLRAFVKERVPETLHVDNTIAIGNDHPNGKKFSLTPGTIEAFDHFLDKTNEEGLTYWFPQEPMDHWCELGTVDRNMQGWEWFLRRIKDNITLQRAFGREIA